MKNKVRITKKIVNNSFRRVYSICYCSLQTLLSESAPAFYTCGIYGWNADIYDFGDVAIVTGYRPFGEDVPFEIVEKYEVKAQKIKEKYAWDYSRQKKVLNKLIHEFLADVQEEAKKI